MVAGSQTAHALAYRIVYRQTQFRIRDLLSTGHGYMVGHPGWIPLALGMLVALELLGFVWTLVSAVGHQSARPSLPAWAFALLPLIGFTLQEFLERWFMGGSLPWWFVVQPTFRVGLLLQLPFGLAVYLMARLLLRATEQIAETLRIVPVRRVILGGTACWEAVEAPLRAWLFPVGRFSRGPPVGVTRTAFA